MFDRLNIRESIGNALIRAGKVISGQHGRGIDQQTSLRGHFTAHLVRRKGVKMEPRTIGIYEGHNDLTTEGVNRLWDTFFGKASPVTQIDPWYIGLINNSPAPSLSIADTLASHTGWSEFTSYSGNRKAWNDADSASKVKSSSSVSAFVMSGSGDIYGIFLASVASGTSGVLWNGGAFSNIPSVISGDTLNVTYAIRG